MSKFHSDLFKSFCKDYNLDCKKIDHIIFQGGRVIVTDKRGRLFEIGK